MLARTVAHISRSALHHNVDLLSERAGVPLMPAIKANAYGHDMELVAGVLADHPQVGGMVVAMPIEAMQLGALNLKKPILLLTPAPAEHVSELVELGIRLHISSWEEAQRLPKNARVHLKVNTGMNRLGLRPEQAIELGQWLNERQMLEGIYTHFSSADSDKAFTEQQCQKLQQVTQHFPETVVHASNSMGILNMGQFPNVTMARPGLSTYGYAVPKLRGILPLKPVMSMRAQVIQQHTVPTGEFVSYSNLWTAQHDTQVAVIAIGYADGYPRNATNKAQVLVTCRDGNKHLRPILGRICMDVCMVDITGLNVQIGDWVEIWGHDLVTATHVSIWGETIEYEILTGIGQRVKRVLTD